MHDSPHTSPDQTITGHSLEFRQLRHQTKNALQRIMMRVLEDPRLGASREGRQIAEDVGRYIRLSAMLSDALFGLTHAPPPLPERLRLLSNGLIALHGDDTQMIHLLVSVSEHITVGPERADNILRIVHELVSNAVQHGMKKRLLGRILVRLDGLADGNLLLSVANDGWRMEEAAPRSEGLEIVQELAWVEGGEVRIKTCPQTAVEVLLPAKLSI